MSVATNQYAAGETVTFEVDTTSAVDGSPITAQSATVAVVNAGTGAGVAGSPATVISAGKIVVTVPASMTGALGAYRATVTAQLDASTTRLPHYDYEIVYTLARVPATYDPTTLLGKTRLLAQDTDPGGLIFDDGEIQAFLDMSSQAPMLAGAKALRVIAANQVYTLKAIKLLGLQTNAHLMGAELRAIADDYEQRYENGDDGTGSLAGLFDVAETVVDEFAFRERVQKEFERDFPSV